MIIFKIIIHSKEQLIYFVSELNALYIDRKVLIVIDQEGGRVARLKLFLSKEFKPADLFGKINDGSGEERDQVCVVIKEHVYKGMEILQVAGIDYLCAPVAGSRYKYTDKVIGDRSFVSNVAKIIDVCSSLSKIVLLLSIICLVMAGPHAIPI